jgi:hypothetical protein
MILIWRASGPSAPRFSIFEYGGEKWDGTEAVPPMNNDNQSYDLDLEGIRSLGAAPADQCFVFLGKGMC